MTIKILATVRAFILAEGYWSKAQKNAVYNLTRYISSKEETHYQQFLQDLVVYKGDKRAHIEILKDDTDFSVVDQGFIQGNSDPSEVRLMGYVFKYLRWESHIAAADKYWSLGEEKLQELENFARDVHHRIEKKLLTTREQKDLYARINSLNHDLTEIENKFSRTLVLAANWITNIFFWGNFFILISFSILGALGACLLARPLLLDIQAIQRGTDHVQKGDLSNMIAVKSKSELGLLATSFNQMTRGLATETKERERAQKLAGLGIWKWKPSKGMFYWSNQVYEILQLSLDQAPSEEAFLSRLHPEDRPAFEKLKAEALRQKDESVQGEFRLLFNEAGVEKNHNCNLSLQVGIENEETVILGIIQDVTDRKIAEHLRIERDAAQKSDHAKSVFLANMSHELRTPLHGILSFARFGQQKIETASKEKLKLYFTEICDSGGQLMSLLNDLLDLSKLESGKVDYLFSKGDLVAVAKQIISKMYAFAEERGVTIEFVDSFNETLSRFDNEKIKRVLQNLISNAIKFSTKGTIIQVQVTASADNVRCEVINLGVGIPETELKTIFDKFTQSSRTRTGAGGTGLGLAICKEIIQHHGGKIWAENLPDGRTKLSFVIPTEPPQSQMSKESKVA